VSAFVCVREREIQTNKQTGRQKEKQTEPCIPEPASPFRRGRCPDSKLIQNRGGGERVSVCVCVRQRDTNKQTDRRTEGETNRALHT